MSFSFPMIQVQKSSDVLKCAWKKAKFVKETLYEDLKGREKVTRTQKNPLII